MHHYQNPRLGLFEQCGRSCLAGAGPVVSQKVEAMQAAIDAAQNKVRLPPTLVTVPHAQPSAAYPVLASLSTACVVCVLCVVQVREELEERAKSLEEMVHTSHLASILTPHIARSGPTGRYSLSFRIVLIAVTSVIHPLSREGH